MKGTRRGLKAVSTPTARSGTGSREATLSSGGAKKNARRRSAGRNVSQSMAEEDGTQMEQPAIKKASGATRRRRNNVSVGKGEQQAMTSVLRQFALATVEKGIPGLVNEFMELRSSTSTPPPKTAFDANADKNRYKDVICGDNSRVVLTWPPNSTNDYIHANFVPVRGDEKKFICTQGPTDKTLDDFWRMIWQLKCRAIVMLCGIMEQGKKKCVEYWPEKPDDTMTTATSNITIKNCGVSEAEKALTVTMLDVSAEGETIQVQHIFWNNWPDRGVPQNVMAALRLLARLKTFSPVVVHCSAGIGRTGTIVGLEIAQQTLLRGEQLSMPAIVKELRAHRHGGVQTEMQFIYMHRVLMGLAENKKLVKKEEIEPFYEAYEAFLKSKGC